MEVLFHFAFQMIKIAILGLFYLGLLLLFIQIPTIAKIPFFQRVKKIRRAKRFIWVLICFILFVWQFSYWGDHGLGDYSRVPIGFGKEIEQLNYSGMYISPSGYENQMFGIENYSIDNGYCFGSTSEENGFYIWDLSTNDVQKISTYEEYENGLRIKNLQSRIVFHNFEEAYDLYWSGWRFWLLP